MVRPEAQDIGSQFIDVVQRHDRNRPVAGCEGLSGRDFRFS